MVYIPTKYEQVCSYVKDCPMTGGFYIGGGLYVCWLHAFFLPDGIFKGQQMVALKGDRS